MPLNWDMIKSAIENRRSISFYYQDHYREAYPHCLGSYKSKCKVLVYQFGGNTSSGPVIEQNEKNWRAMLLDNIVDLQITDSVWQTHESYSGPGKYFDDVVIAIPY